MSYGSAILCIIEGDHPYFSIGKEFDLLLLCFRVELLQGNTKNEWRVVQ